MFLIKLLGILQGNIARRFYLQIWKNQFCKRCVLANLQGKRQVNFTCISAMEFARNIFLLQFCNGNRLNKYRCKTASATKIPFQIPLQNTDVPVYM